MNTFEKKIQQAINKDRKRSRKSGWDFKERDFHAHTIGDFISAVMAINNSFDAKRFYQGYVTFMSCLPAEVRDSKHTPEEVAKSNIGWCFGEGMPQERIVMWRRVCGASHPVFGSMAIPPSPREAFQAGQKMARRKTMGVGDGC